MSKATDVGVTLKVVADTYRTAYRQVRNAFGLATPIGWVVPPRGTFRRKHLELLVALRRAFDR